MRPPPPGRAPMSEMRWSIIHERWALIAPDRRTRPGAHRHAPATPQSPDPNCPFCPGNEEKTPPQTDILPGSSPNDPAGWRARAVPNKYPAVGGGPAPNPHSPGPFPSRAGSGRHEVIVDSPVHLQGLADLPDDHTGEILIFLQRRVREFYRNDSIRAITVFKNHGATAGASLSHSHIQVVGLPEVPSSVAKARETGGRFRQKEGRALLAYFIETEIKEKARIIEEGKETAVLCPFASRFPYETLISPWPVEESFCDSPRESLHAVGGALARTLRRIKTLLADPPLNVAFHMEIHPGDADSPPACAWYIEVLPRLAVLAGLEAGFGMHINVTSPEDAAAELRGASAEIAG